MAENLVATETKQEVEVKASKTKSDKTGDLFLDVAHEVESLSKTQALNQAQKLAETVETSYLKLGGILKLIFDNQWFEGFENFDKFVFETYGFRGRKARYLMDIYTHLVNKQIPWDKVHHLGWTKLKELAPSLTLENLDEMVAKAENLTVAELQILLKPTAEGEGEKTQKTTSDLVKVTFKFKTDQSEIVNQALAKAKGELNTNFDEVAIENICASYVGGNISTSTLVNMINAKGFKESMLEIAEAFPEWDIEVDKAGAKETEEVAQ